MTDYHQLLEEDLTRVGDPILGLEDLQRRHARRERGRRTRAIVVGLAVALAAGAFLATTFRGQLGTQPAGPPISWTSHTDRYGWTIDVPKGWRTEPLSSPAEGARFQGSDLSVQIAIGPPPSGWPAKLPAPAGLTLPPSNDSAFPLSADQILSPVDGGLGGRFNGDGLQFDVVVQSSTLPLSTDDGDIVDHMIGSIAFQPWTPGDVRHDWVAIEAPSEDVSWITLEGGDYMLFRTPDETKLYGPISCAKQPPKKLRTTSDGSAVLDCPDGSTWQMDAGGGSGGSGEAVWNDPPPQWPIVTAHDGTMIAYVIPGYFPPGTGGSGYGCQQTGLGC